MDLSTISLEQLVSWIRWADLRGCAHIVLNGVPSIEVAAIKAEVNRRVPSEPHQVSKESDD